MKGLDVNGNRESGGGGPPRPLLLSTVALFGATTIVAQVLLLRECLVVVAGNELFIALFFGCWFLGIAAGAAVGAAWKAPTRRLTVLVPLFLLVQVVLLPALMLAVRDLRVRWGMESLQLMPFGSILRMTLLHLCPFSFLTGLTFPMLCRLIAETGGPSSRSIGSVYAVESFGSLVGGAAVTFVFAVYCRPLTGAWVLGALTAGNLAWFSVRIGTWKNYVGAGVSAVMALAFTVIVASPIRPAVERWGAGLRHRAYGPNFEWLDERYTPYQQLALVRLGEQYSLLSNGRFIASFPDPYATRAAAHVMMSQSERPRRVLLIDGDPAYLRSLLLYPLVEIDYVEIDPAVLEVVRPYLEAPYRRALDDPRVRVYHEDARRFVRRRLGEIARGRGERYDVVLCCAPDPSTAALNRFYTYDFFDQVRRLLTPSGVFVSSIRSGVNYFGPELLDYVGSVYQALTRAFGHVLATPGSRAFLFATEKDDLLTSDIERLIARFDARRIDDPGFSPLHFYAAYQTDQLNLVNRSLRRSLGKVRSNLDVEPVTYLYHLRLWNRFAGQKSQRFFSVIEHYYWRAVAALALLLCIVAAIFGRRLIPSVRAVYPLAAGVICLTGMSGMVSSIVLLLLFQNFHGSLYREVGLLVALFMAGLTAGGLFGNRLGRDENRRLILNIGICALAFCAFLGGLGLATLGASHGLAEALFNHAAFFYVAMVAAGGLTGVPFPLLGRLALASGRDVGRAGGTLESLDHLGAFVSAFLTGTVLIPVSGIGATLGVFGLFELLAAIVLFAAAWKTAASG